jgi:hypothetical protein
VRKKDRDESKGFSYRREIKIESLPRMTATDIFDGGGLICKDGRRPSAGCGVADIMNRFAVIGRRTFSVPAR